MYLHLIFFTIPVALAQLLQDPVDTDISSAGDPWRDYLPQNGAPGRPLFDVPAALPEEGGLDLPSSKMMVSSESISQSNQPLLPSEHGDASAGFQTADKTAEGCSTTPYLPGRKLRARQQPQGGKICPNPPQSVGKPLQEEIPLQGKPEEGIPLQGTTLQWTPFKSTPLGWEVDWPAPGVDNSKNPQFYPEQKDQNRIATKLHVSQCGTTKKTYCCGGPEELHPRGTMNVNDCVFCMFMT